MNVLTFLFITVTRGLEKINTLMRALEFLSEASPDTPKGSVSRDLILSKLWLCHELQRLDLTDFDQIYILGSWYGAMAFILRKLRFDFDHVFCVDNDNLKHHYLEKVLRRHQISDISSHCVNVDNINYPSGKLLVINTSTNDIKGTKWLDRVPRGTVVAIQGRDNQETSNGIETLYDFDQTYPLDEEMFLDSISLKGVDDLYKRFMKIGIRWPQEKGT